MEKKMMTELEAWKYLAKVWAGGEESEYGLHQVLINGNYLEDCLCLCTWRMKQQGMIYAYIERQMDKKIGNEKIRLGAGNYIYDRDAEGAKKRAALCRKFARQLMKEQPVAPKRKAVKNGKVKAK